MFGNGYIIVHQVMFGNGYIIVHQVMFGNGYISVESELIWRLLVLIIQMCLVIAMF
jgi:hypothetical protein